MFMLSKKKWDSKLQRQEKKYKKGRSKAEKEKRTKHVYIDVCIYEYFTYNINEGWPCIKKLVGASFRVYGSDKEGV